MKIIFSIFLVAAFFSSFSQGQEHTNVFVQNNINTPLQNIQTSNNSNFDELSSAGNERNSLMQQQINFSDDHVGNINQVMQSISDNNPTKEVDYRDFQGFDMSFSMSSHSSSSKKKHKHTFHKKLAKFNRNFYGRLASHKKSKHLVDVCFFKCP